MTQQAARSDMAITDFHGHAKSYSDALSSKVQYLENAKTNEALTKGDQKAIKDFIDFNDIVNEKLKWFSKFQGNLGTKLNIPKSAEKKLKKDISQITTKIEKEVKCKVIDSISVSKKTKPKAITKVVDGIRKGLLKINETNSTYAMKIFLGTDLSSDETINESKSEHSTGNHKTEEENEECVTNGANQVDWSEPAKQNNDQTSDGKNGTNKRQENNGKHPTTGRKENHKQHKSQGQAVAIESKHNDLQWYKDQVDKLEKKLGLLDKEHKDCVKISNADKSKIAKLENDKTAKDDHVKKLEAQIGQLTNDLSVEMSNKISSNETSVENISIRNRPMNIAEEYNSFCSNVWLEAKISIDSHFGEKGNQEFALKFLNHVLQLAETETLSAQKEMLHYAGTAVLKVLSYPPGTEVGPIKLEVSKKKEEKVTTSITTTLCDSMRMTADSVDLKHLAQKLEKTLKKDGNMKKYQKMLSHKPIQAYIDAALSTTWKMAIQRPPMHFHCEQLDTVWQAHKQEPYWDCNPDKPGAKVRFYVYPALYHGPNLMVKGKVFID